MPKKPSAMLLAGLLLTALAGCGGSSKATSNASDPPGFSTTEVAAFNEGCKSLGLGGSLGDAPVCECALEEMEKQTTPSSFESEVTAWKEQSAKSRQKNREDEQALNEGRSPSDAGEPPLTLPARSIMQCVTKQQNGEVPEPDGLPSSSGGSPSSTTTETQERQPESAPPSEGPAPAEGEQSHE